jgi:hypothetical protein
VLGVAPDGSWMASASFEEVRVWDPTTGTELNIIACRGSPGSPRTALKKPLHRLGQFRRSRGGVAGGVGGAAVYAAIGRLAVFRGSERADPGVVGNAGAGSASAQVTRTQVPALRVKPRPIRLRRLSPAVRRLSHASFLVVPR